MKVGSSLFARLACAAGLWLCVAAPIAAPAMAQTSPVKDSAHKWGPFIDFDGKAGTKRNIGEGDLFLPLAQSSTTMLFGDVRARFDDRDSSEGNFGLGVRHMQDNGWNVGAYGYFDRRNTAYGNDFNQATFGVEALSLDWDVRGNVYRPLGDRVKQVDSLNTATLSGTSVTFRGGEEVSMGGYDGEVGWRVPVFADDGLTQLRVYGGGYRFTAEGVDSVAGPRARLDLTIDEVPHLWPGARLVLGLEAQHDSPRGTQEFATINLRIPLEVFGGTNRSRSPLTPMERRMTDAVVRDVDIVSRAGAFGAAETATQTASGQTITVLDSSSTTGAALPGAVTGAGANSTVILSGSFNTGTTQLTLQSGQTVMGAGNLTVMAPSGRTATLTTAGATITGNVGSSNHTIVMANNSTLTGMTINNTDNSGNNALAVGASGVSGAKIVNNTLNATETAGGTAHGVDVVSGSSNVTVSGNTITARGSGGASIVLDVQVNGSSATVSNNSLSASGGTTRNNTVTLTTANILSGSSGNTAVAGSCNVGTAGTGGTVTFTNAAACGP